MENNENNLDNTMDGISNELLQELFGDIIEFDNDSVIAYESCCDNGKSGGGCSGPK